MPMRWRRCDGSFAVMSGVGKGWAIPCAAESLRGPRRSARQSITLHLEGPAAVNRRLQVGAPGASTGATSVVSSWCRPAYGACSRVSLGFVTDKKVGCRMSFHRAAIERSNRRNLERVEVDITVRDSSPGSKAWHGEFISRSADGILPDDQLVLTLDNGQRGTARVTETHFDSRTPAATTIRFTGTSPLA